jgi:hypothetical protein
MGAVGFAFLSGKYEESRKEEAYKALLILQRNSVPMQIKRKSEGGT